MSDQSPAPQKDANLDMLNMIYVMYLAALFVGLTGVIGVGLAYYYQREASPWMATHYTFQIHTFWKGLLITLAGVLLSYVTGPVIFLVVVVWWGVRCVMGLKQAVNKKPIEDPLTWLF